MEQRHFAPRTVGQLTFESESSGGAGFSEVEIHAAQGEGTVAAHRELRAGSQVITSLEGEIFTSLPYVVIGCWASCDTVLSMVNGEYCVTTSKCVACCAL